MDLYDIPAYCYQDKITISFVDDIFKLISIEDIFLFEFKVWWMLF